MTKNPDKLTTQHGTTVEWLLEPDNPSVRSRTLQDLLDRPLTDSAVVQAKSSIQKSPQVTKLLSYQLHDGTWRGPRGDLWDEKGSVFTLLLLGELGAASSENTRRALDYLHEHYQLPTGRMAYRPLDSPRRKENTSTWMWCITAIILRAAVLLGHGDHPLVKAAIKFFEEFHEDKGGWHCSAYSNDRGKVRPPNCYMGGIKALSAFSLIPSSSRSKKIKAIIDQEVETCLDNRVYFYRVDSKGQPATKRAWLKFAFPRYWRSDVLEAADVLTGLGVHDSRIQDALDLIGSKQQPDGRWLLDFSETNRAWVQLDQEGTPSKWVTLRALRTLHNAESK